MEDSKPPPSYAQALEDEDLQAEPSSILSILPTSIRISETDVVDTQTSAVLLKLNPEDARAELTAKKKPKVILRAGEASNASPQSATIRYRGPTAHPDVVMIINGEELVMLCRDSGKPLQYTFQSKAVGEGLQARTWVMESVKKGFLKKAADDGREVARIEDGLLQIFREKILVEDGGTVEV